MPSEVRVYKINTKYVQSNNDRFYLQKWLRRPKTFDLYDIELPLINKDNIENILA
jgi:hypothetical protein